MQDGVPTHSVLVLQVGHRRQWPRPPLARFDTPPQDFLKLAVRGNMRTRINNVIAAHLTNLDHARSVLTSAYILIVLICSYLIWSRQAAHLGEPAVNLYPINGASLGAAFPDWYILGDSEAWCAIRQPADAPCSHRFAPVDRPVLTASTPTALAIQLAALECPLGITPTG